MKIGATLGVVLAVLLSVGAVASAETVQVVRSDGEVTYRPTSDGVPRPASVGTAISRGDLIQLADKSSASLRFADGAELDVSGPAVLRFRLLGNRARTVELQYGTINRFIVKKVTTGIMGTCQTYCALQNGVVFARSEVGAKTLRAIYKLFSGSGAIVGRGDERRPLTTQKPAVFECDNCEPWCDRPGLGARGTNKVTRMKIGDKVVTLGPPEAFSIEQTPDGGVVITSISPAGTSGVVTLDDYTTFYLGAGQSIFFGPEGEVNRHTGIIHVYGPLNKRGLYTPRDTPADISFTGTED